MANNFFLKLTGGTSIKRKFLFFSLVLFAVVLVGGSIAFILSMRQIVNSGKSSELSKMAEIQRTKLEASVNGEIAIALKMADSPLIKRYFQDPDDPELAAYALEEIAGYRRAFIANTVFWVSDRDTMFHSDDNEPFFIDVKDPSNYWYLMTLNETEKYNFNINYNPDLKVTNLWINAPVFDANHRPLGILGTGIDLTAFIDSIYKDYDGTADLYFFNKSGEITGARDTRLVADKESLSNAFGAVGREILNRVASNSGEIQAFSNSAADIAICPVPALEWYAVAIQPTSLSDYLKTSMTALFLIMVSLIIVIFIIFNVIISAFLRPLDGMVETLNQISLDWDMTKRLEISQKDEIGTLGNFFNQTFEKIHGLLTEIRGKTFSLSDTGEELSANMDGTAMAVDKINDAIQNMKNQVLNQTEEVIKSAGAMERIISGLEKLNDHIAVQVGSVAQSSSAIEEMLANIRSVTETLIKNTSNITSLAASSEAGREDLQKVSADIQEIAKESEGLLEINSVMQNIASQTNLLSMNAAIEAAHAGESGKGFAVVADEIRKLAENSGKQSKTISAVLKKIKGSIDMITKSTTVVLERFGSIEQEIKTVSNQETQIRSAMEEQEVGSRHILEAITQLNTVTDLVHQASEDMATESKEAINESGNLKHINAAVAASMDEMTSSAEQINSSAVRVKEISQENKQNIEILSGEIRKFKVD